MAKAKATGQTFMGHATKETKVEKRLNSRKGNVQYIWEMTREQAEKMCVSSNAILEYWDEFHALPTEVQEKRIAKVEKRLKKALTK